MFCRYWGGNSEPESPISIINNVVWSNAGSQRIVVIYLLPFFASTKRRERGWVFARVPAGVSLSRGRRRGLRRRRQLRPLVQQRGSRVVLIWPAEGQHQSLSQPPVSIYFHAYCEAFKKNTFFEKKKARNSQINNIKNKFKIGQL